ncbi:MAG: hypothetical protein WBC44_10585 [Planctomycetaceae bacterium]
MGADAAALELPVDAFACHGLSAVGAAEQTTGQRDIGTTGPPVPAAQDILTGLERRPVDQWSMPARVERAATSDLADIEAIAQQVGKSGPMEPRLARAVDVSLALQLVGQALERVPTRRVELEQADDGLRFLRVRLDGLGAIAFDVQVSERGQPRRPALPHALVQAFEHLLAKIVAVVLGDGRHDVKRKSPGGAGTELVLDEAELYAAGIFELLQPNGVPHVAADAIELMAEDRLDLLPLGVDLDPVDHCIEDFAGRAAAGRLVQLELPHDVPALPLGLQTRGP